MNTEMFSVARYYGGGKLFFFASRIPRGSSKTTNEKSTSPLKTSQVRYTKNIWAGPRIPFHFIIFYFIFHRRQTGGGQGVCDGYVRRFARSGGRVEIVAWARGVKSIFLRVCV